MAKRAYSARDDDPQFDEIYPADSFDAIAEHLLTGAHDAIDGIEANGVDWNSVSLIVDVRGADSATISAALSESLPAAAIVDSGGVISIRIGASSRDAIVDGLRDGVDAVERFRGSMNAWAWDLHFDAESQYDYDE